MKGKEEASETMLNEIDASQLSDIEFKVLEKMRRKGNPSALLVGMQTGDATVENSMEFPQKTKNGIAL